MKTLHKGAALRVIAVAAAGIVAAEIIISWRMFDYRASGLVFSAACAAIALTAALYALSEIDGKEEYEEVTLKCRACGETFECHFAPNAPDEEKEEFQRLRRCPLCGGELEKTDAGE